MSLIVECYVKTAATAAADKHTNKFQLPALSKEELTKKTKYRRINRQQ